MSKVLSVLTGLILFTLAYDHPHFAQSSVPQSSETKSRIGNTKSERSQDVAPKPGAPTESQGTILDIEGSPYLGEKSAKLTLVEFSDYE